MGVVTQIRSGGAFGRLTAVVLDDGRTITRPASTDEVPVLTNYQASGVVEVAVPHPTDAQSPQLVLSLGERNWPAYEVRDDDPRVSIWSSLVAAGVITDEMLADIPEPAELALARTKASAARTISEKWSEWERLGIAINGVTLRATVTDANLYLGEITVNTMAGTNPLLADINGDLVEVPLADVGKWVGEYNAVLRARRIAIDAATKAVQAAETTGEVDAALEALEKA